MLETPLGPDALTLVGLSGEEGISRLFRLELDLVADPRRDIPFDRLVGQPATVGLAGGRYFNGLVSRFGAGTRDAVGAGFRLELVPQLWLLTRRSGSRIFQQQSVPEIVERVLADSDVEATFELEGSYFARDYCVQYRESDFDFVSRLLAEEGIFYFFKHNAGGHTLVVADRAQALPSAGTFAFAQSRTPGERVFDWEKTQELRAGKVTLRDYEFELPANALEVSAAIPESVRAGSVTHTLRPPGSDTRELYDYPGGYAERFDGIDPGGGERPQDIQRLLQVAPQVAAIRMQEEAAGCVVVTASSTCLAAATGHTFALAGHFDADGRYLLTGVSHSASQPAAARGTKGFEYANSFTCIPDGVTFRPPRTPRAVVAGAQTAFVVGPAGATTFSDRYGRVKVQFHWDREGQHDAQSSCWIRVAQPVGSPQPGFYSVPEVGDEVLVAFLEGDPDQPVIVGTVPNVPPRT
jgi:type VI secretion system secreted protein VgrG